MNRTFPAVLLFGFAVSFTAIAAAESADPLPSWNDGEVKLAITRFVTNVTTEGSPGFVPPGPIYCAAQPVAKKQRVRA
jgi:hypothetical protein